MGLGSSWSESGAGFDLLLDQEWELEPVPFLKLGRRLGIAFLQLEARGKLNPLLDLEKRRGLNPLREFKKGKDLTSPAATERGGLGLSYRADMGLSRFVPLLERDMRRGFGLLLELERTRGLRSSTNWRRGVGFAPF